LSYLDLKEMVRTSLEHSFLPGESIWTDLKAHTMRGPCKGARPDGTPNNSCSSWLGRNEKAALQWKLETAFARFEAGF